MQLSWLDLFLKIDQSVRLRQLAARSVLSIHGGFKDEVQLSITDGWVAEDV